MRETANMVYQKIFFILLFGIFISTVLYAQDAVDLDTLELPPVEKKTWSFKRFPIMAWWPPPGWATSEDFRAYREAGFTIYPANPDTGFEQSIRKAEDAGLPVMVWRTLQGFDSTAHRGIAFPSDNQNVIGWITSDEPFGLHRIVEEITNVNRLMREDPGRWAFFNLLPPSDSQNDPPTEAIIEAAVRSGMPVLSFDNYVINSDGTDRTEEHFNNLEILRRASVNHDVPFWAFALTLKHRHFRRPSESDLRWKQFTNLAYGAKGLWYFCYWGPTKWEGWDKVAIVDPSNGKKTELYSYVKDINHAVLAMGDILLGLTSDGVVHTDPPVGHNRFQAGQYWISGIEAKDALIGLFHDRTGTSYALVVNKQHGMNMSAEKTVDTIKLTFNPDVRSVMAVNWLDGQPGEVALREQRASLRIAGGTGVLLRVEISSDEYKKDIRMPSHRDK